MVKVACFFTGGFTESGAMQSFLQKINGNIFLKQFCPNKPPRRKIPGTRTQLVKGVSGLTGPGLRKYVYQYIENHPKELKEFDAVLIEDDLDGRYTRQRTEGDETTKVSAKTPEFLEQCETIKREIRMRLGKESDFPVIFFWASPEIEAWFLADWTDSFGSIYGPSGTNVLDGRENQFFSSRFQPYVRKNILKEYQGQVENYGYFMGDYKKLSDELILALDGDFKVQLNQEDTSVLAKSISENKKLYYSKQNHGVLMLQNLRPETVQKKCPVYFAEAFAELAAL